MNKRTRELVLAAILTALSILITYSPLKVPVPYTTVTLGSHIPTLISMFISPWVVIMTVIGSCIGFAMVIPYPTTIVVVARAATHLLFALVGYKMISDRKTNIFLTILITAILHTLTESAAFFFLAPMFMPDKAGLYGTYITAASTIVHHFIDFAVTIPIAIALGKAKVIPNVSKLFKPRRKTHA
jgi:niacin transporter